MIKKIIGFILILVIFFFAIKAIAFLPFFTDLVIGKNMSPFQIGTDYVNEINKVYPTQGNQIRYNSNPNTNIIGKITLEKLNGRLILTIENANPQAGLNVWLTNTPQITDQTEYIDFGQLYKSGSIKQYVVDMNGGDISFDKFNNVLIVDKNNQVYASLILK